MKLRPFFCYYGGKWRAAPKYPAPVYDTIIEPFAGAAGYATRHHTRNVVLIDADPTIAALWQYLIKVKSSEIASLPLEVEHVDNLPVCQEAKSLIGFWLNKGSAAPCKRPSAWMRAGKHTESFWGEAIRARIAAQVDQIRHWRAVHSSYAYSHDAEATWFVDPPYQVAGKHYKVSAVDYGNLADWCRSRRGQVIVCEAAGADWLPFEPFATIKANSRKAVSHEVVWYQSCNSNTEHRTDV